jgi:hypothetical protein
MAISGMHESVPASVSVPRSDIREHDADRIFVPGLDDTLHRCYTAWQMPGEAGCRWSRPGQTIDLRNYQFFPGHLVPGTAFGGGPD